MSTQVGTSICGSRGRVTRGRMVRDELVHREYDRGRRNQGTGNHFRPRKNTQEGQEGFRRHRADPGWSVFGARERDEGTDRASDARKTLMTAM